MPRDGLTIISTRIYPGDGSPFPGFVHVQGGKITAVGRGRPDASVTSGRVVEVGDHPVIPGLIDLHVHGSGGYDAASGDIDQLNGMARFLAENGVTAFQPTTGAAPVAELEASIKAVRDFTRHGGSRPASGQGALSRSLGLHMEGPFLSKERPGAMPAAFLLEPDAPLMARWIELSEGTVNHVTLAPELPGALDLVRYLAASNITVAMGHTQATYAEAMAGFDAGITLSTHTFNAMRGLHHREPGALGAALTRKGLFCELIADCIHVHPAALSLLVAAQGCDSVCLISDALPPAGLPPGEYEFLGRRVTLDERGVITLPDGTLAGSSAVLIRGLRNMVETVGVPFESALKMATVNPARVARVSDRKGSLAVGKDADIVILDDDYKVVWCWVEGEQAKGPGED